MSTSMKPARHAQLFELLRQQCLSQQVETRLRMRMSRRVSRGDALMLKSLAAASFQKQRLPTIRDV